MKKLKTVAQFNQVSMRKSNFNHYVTGVSFPYFASGIESAWAAWMPLILLESSEYLWYLEDYKRDGVGWFLGARDDGAEFGDDSSFASCSQEYTLLGQETV